MRTMMYEVDYSEFLVVTDCIPSFVYALCHSPPSFLLESYLINTLYRKTIETYFTQTTTLLPFSFYMVVHLYLVLLPLAILVTGVSSRNPSSANNTSC
ncbi:hypothetical protein BDW02DRAFT_181950 [Decorospora gaudefroyi]|uniref:Uncharacterized protein n=1 Tax=Decorospora gaudefroyi TaxID=184978 RepID=A0A6A5KJ26_9PLEO|nr:hypothetical protein BDW02DRAFT_181950 [Decorospora gaudefroyi]